MSETRDGDVVLVRATVHQRRGEGNQTVRFLNGDSLPLRSVEVVRVETQQIRVGDSIRILSGDQVRVPEARVVSVHAELETPQLVYQEAGKWCLQTALISSCRRNP